MQSPRSPLDWEHESKHESDLDALDEVHERVVALEARLQHVEKFLTKHMQRGLIGGLLHSLDIVLRIGVEAWLQGPPAR